MGNYLDFALKIAHRGNTGSHKGKRKLACLSENYICALLLFFSVFGLWHKANSAHFSGSYEKICSQIKKLTCNCSFSELTSHTTKAIRKSFEKRKTDKLGLLWLDHSLSVNARQLLKPPCTERYARWCERTAANHRLLLDCVTVKV